MQRKIHEINRIKFSWSIQDPIYLERQPEKTPTHNCIARLFVGCAAGLEALRAVCLQTFLGSFQLREATPFLLDQEIFGAADLLGRAQNALPIHDSFPEEDRISFAWVGGPLFQMQ